MTGPAVVARCRFCVGQVFPAEAKGSTPAITDAHPCCVYWYEIRGLSYCPACRISEARRNPHNRRRRD